MGAIPIVEAHPRLHRCLGRDETRVAIATALHVDLALLHDTVGNDRRQIS